MSDKVVYELSVDLPSLPSGDPVQIPGLGTFENGSTNDVTDDQAQAYRSYHQRQTPVVDEETQEIRGSELEIGPTLLQASKSMYGVEVTVVHDKSKNEGGDE